MPRKHIELLFLNAVFFVFGQYAAYTQQIVASKGSFGIDHQNKIIVWHAKGLDSIAAATNYKMKDIVFDEKFTLTLSIAKLSYSEVLPVSKKGDTYALYISDLPIIHITNKVFIKDNSKVFTYFTYYDGSKLIENETGIEHRGNISLGFPKKSYDLEFWTDSLSKKPKDLKFKGLRNDDDWILDGLYNEPLRLRSYFSLKLWLSFHKPHYELQEPKAKSTIDLKFVELFKNSEYRGLYTLSESVDSKLLKLKKNENNLINGELFKASSYEGAPAFRKAPPYNNVFPHWGGYEMKYPKVDYRFHWEDLAKFTDLVVNGSDEQFSLRIGKELQIDNAIDYYLFVNLLRATDNLGKNFYMARYDKEGPYFFVPWDLDGVMGIIQDGKRIASTNDILSNGLFDRLLKVNPDNYRDRVKSRWKALRKDKFSNNSLFSRIDKIYSKFDTEGIYEREWKVWPNQIGKEEHYEYLKNWLRNRLIFLDEHFEML